MNMTAYSPRREPELHANGCKISDGFLVVKKDGSEKYTNKSKVFDEGTKFPIKIVDHSENKCEQIRNCGEQVFLTTRNDIVELIELAGLKILRREKLEYEKEGKVYKTFFYILQKPAKSI